MLYQTHFCNPFSTTIFSSPLLSSQVDKQMECLVKGGFGLKQTHQQTMFLDDFCSNFTPDNNGVVSVSGDDFFVDELLNLNNDEEDEQQQQNEPIIDSVEVEETPISKKISPFHSPPLDSVLSVPAEEADLEWLSNFVEESFSQFSTPYPAGFVKPEPKPGFTPSSKARRSKRARTGGRVWSSPSTTTPCSSPSPEFGPLKKQKKNETGPGGNGGGLTGLPRRCSHCGVQKTPQWRAGPMGAKTLCNACGVRFKSGRLLPEYRPACSPTYSSELHSNSHRKVLEMRKKKETISGQPESESLHHPVSSFG